MIFFTVLTFCSLLLESEIIARVSLAGWRPSIYHKVNKYVLPPENKDF